MNIIETQSSQANILIVDDTPDNLDLLAAILQKRGYQTICVDNGAEAIEIAHSGWAELILLDIQMPEMDGYQVCHSLKSEAHTREIPVIFISALDDFADKKKAFKVGGVDYINKPFEIKEVVVRVANQMAIQSSKTKIIELNNQLENKVKERTAELEESNQQLKQEINRRQQAQDRLMKIALSDPITGFPNRNSFSSRLKQALRDTEKQPDYFFAVILLECDRFKNIKRTLSHIDCNQLLMSIAHALDSCLPKKSALLSRLEGEEFGIFLDSIKDEKDAIAIVEKIQQKLTQPFVIKRRKILINVNIGIVIGNKDYQDTDRLINDADIAMQQAQEQESDRYQVFKPEMYIQLQKDREFANHEMALLQAIKRQEFVNYYLPITSLKKRNVVELEALVRWHHPHQGIILPDQFIAQAEEMGLMNAIGNLVLRQACKQIKSWKQKIHQSDLGICINLSAKQFFHSGLISKVDLILRKTKLQGHHLKFDISETVIIENATNTLKILKELKKRQVKLSLDNFGIGYSSLTCLHRFPFDELKIDRALFAHIGQQIPNLEQETSATLLLKQIITIAHQLNMVVTATGIENNYQLNLLKDLGCDRGQGYLISQLLDRDSVEQFLINFYQ